MPHAVARLRAERLARSTKPYRGRGWKAVRCARCRVPQQHCTCALMPTVETSAGMCILMHGNETLKPTNTGWLVADVVTDTLAFAWTRTDPDQRLVALLRDPLWTPYVVFQADGIAPERVVRDVASSPVRRPLFVLLDGSWAEARRMFRASRYLDGIPVLALDPARATRYSLRRTRGEANLCTAEAAALCLRLAGEPKAADALDAWLDVFVARTEDARHGGPQPPASAVPSTD